MDTRGATFRVETGVPELAGKRQRLYVKYLLCGMEQLPAELLRMAAVASGCVGLLTAAVVLPGLVRHGLRRHPVNNDPTPR